MLAEYAYSFPITDFSSCFTVVARILRPTVMDCRILIEYT